jgi:hypothetical protein
MVLEGVGNVQLCHKGSSFFRIVVSLIAILHVSGFLAVLTFIFELILQLVPYSVHTIAARPWLLPNINLAPIIAAIAFRSKPAHCPPFQLSPNL